MENKDDFLVDIVLDIVRSSNLLVRLGGQYANEAGLSSQQQYMILALLLFKDNLSMGELGENTLVTKQAITGIVSRLKKGGYLETYKDPKDRRITRVSLTSKGRDALTYARPKRISGNRAAFSVLNETELRQLSTILEKLVTHLKLN